jgi:hypothetical protein
MVNLESGTSRSRAVGGNKIQSMDITKKLYDYVLDNYISLGSAYIILISYLSLDSYYSVLGIKIINYISADEFILHGLYELSIVLTIGFSLLFGMAIVALISHVILIFCFLIKNAIYSLLNLFSKAKFKKVTYEQIIKRLQSHFEFTKDTSNNARNDATILLTVTFIYVLLYYAISSSGNVPEVDKDSFIVSRFLLWITSLYILVIAYFLARFLKKNQVEAIRLATILFIVIYPGILIVDNYYEAYGIKNTESDEQIEFLTTQGDTIKTTEKFKYIGNTKGYHFFLEITESSDIKQKIIPVKHLKELNYLN